MVYIYIGLVQTHAQAEQKLIAGPAVSVTAAAPSRARLEKEAKKEEEQKQQEKRGGAPAGLEKGGGPGGLEEGGGPGGLEEGRRAGGGDAEGEPAGASSRVKQRNILDLEDVRSLASRVGISRREMERLLGIHRPR